jgi:hypothetical protein
MPRRIPDKELLNDLESVADDIGTPTRAEYRERGEYSCSTLERRYDGWHNALKAAGLEATSQYQISKDELIDDLTAVSSGGKAPSTKEYNQQGEYTASTIARRLGSGSWNEAVKTAGLEINEVHKHPDKEVLHALRERAKGNIAPSQSEIADNAKHCPKTYATRYGSYWKGAVAAGLKPQTKCPLNPTEYASFIHAARNLPTPSQRVIGLLRAYTGLTRILLGEFTTDWIAYLNSDRRSTVIQVPAEHLSADKDWNIITPTEWYNPATQEREDTRLEGLLQWCVDHNISDLYTTTGSQHLTDKICEKAEIQRGYASLNMSLGTHLAQQGAEPWFIEKQTGINATKTELDVSYFFLWNHVHRGTTHANYDPPDVVLDPVSPKHSPW